MTYALVQRTISHADHLQISEEDYIGLSSSIDVLVEIVSAEEIYDGVVTAYAELEKDILSTTVEWTIFDNLDETTIRAGKNALARRVSAFLSAVRLYVDTIKTKARIVNPEEGKKYLSTSLSAAYDGHLAYRVMENVRNHAQHRGYPVENITFGHKREYDDEGDTLWIYRTTLKLDIPDLISEGAFKAPIVEELRRGPVSLALMPLIRQYVQCISEIHEDFRVFCRDLENKSLATIDGALSRYEAAFPEHGRKHLAVAVLDDQGNWESFRNLHIASNPYRIHLPNKNTKLHHLTRNEFRS